MKKAKIVVVGDIMLDTFYKGDWRKIGAEDIPVISVNTTLNQLGAASTIANNIKNLEHEVYLFGYVGNDEKGNMIKDMIKKRGIKGKIYNKFKQTIRKSRVNQILRFDEETIEDIDCKEMFYDIKKINPDIIVISDFSKGTITQDLIDRLKTLNKCILVDPRYLDYSGVFLITPNIVEARTMTKCQREEDIVKKLKQRYQNILITKGKDGMTLYEFGKKPFNIPTVAKEVYDVTGAGDTALAVITVCLAEGKSLKDSCVIANEAAGIVVEHTGQYLVSREEICI